MTNKRKKQGGQIVKNGDMCPICNQGTVIKKVIDETFTYNGHEITMSNYCIFECDNCEEAIVSVKTLRETEQPLIDFRRYVGNKLAKSKDKIKVDSND